MATNDLLMALVPLPPGTCPWCAGPLTERQVLGQKRIGCWSCSKMLARSADLVPGEVVGTFISVVNLPPECDHPECIKHWRQTKSDTCVQGGT